jgi:holliday junction DNA helicase RuvA
MITYIEGRLIEKTPTYAVIDCSGIGYHLNISLNTYSKLTENTVVKIHTHLSIREDAHVLYGFADIAEKNLFRELISVSGVGPGTARMILSSHSPEEIQSAILNGDVALLQRIKGIGAKSAQRIIVDLRDRLSKTNLSPGSTTLFVETNSNKKEAIEALVMLGFAKPAAEKAVEKAAKSDMNADSVEKLIKIALKNL